MEKEFITYEQSIKLKELGFNEPCIGWMADWSKKVHLGTNEPSHHHKSSCSAILKQQVFRWFREKYQIFGNIGLDCTTYPKFAYVINEFIGNPRNLAEKEWDWVTLYYSDLYRCQDEAEKECIDKLIELIEGKNIIP